MKESSFVSIIRPLFFLAAVTLLLLSAQVDHAQAGFYVNPAALFTTAGTSTSYPSEVLQEIVAGSTIEPSPDTAIKAETISLVPFAGKGTRYVEYSKQKYHESKHEVEKLLKQKHGNRFSVVDFKVKQTEHGLKGHIHIIENKNDSLIQLGTACTEAERAHRIDIAREFMLNNAELIGFTENEVLLAESTDREYCGNLYFDRYVNGHKMLSSDFHFSFVSQFNFSVSVNIKPITPEMYAAAQQQALTAEEVIKIVLDDMKVPLSKLALNRKSLPKFQLHKYLIDTEPYVIWEVTGSYIHTIDAITGTILRKTQNIKY